MISPSLPSSAVPLERYREFLATKKQRLTRERSIIVEEVFAQHEHFDAEQLIQRLAQRKDSRRVSRSTIYRSLLLLEEAGLLRKVARQDDREVYEHDFGYPHHDHLICKGCHKLIEFENNDVTQLLEEIANKHGFRLESHRLEAAGLCRQCACPPASRPKKLNLL